MIELLPPAPCPARCPDHSQRHIHRRDPSPLAAHNSTPPLPQTEHKLTKHKNALEQRLRPLMQQRVSGAREPHSPRPPRAASH